MTDENYILTIAGFDPTNGAGLTSDLKTFQAHGLYGLSVCTAVTVQNTSEFNACHWIETEVILDQIKILFKEFKIDVVKIGIVQNWEVLSLIIKELKKINSEIKIILDPILKASSGYNFHPKEDLKALDQILEQIFLITPNYEEIKNLYPDKSIEETIEHISTKTNLYLKGGHRTDKIGLDQLFYKTIIQLNIEPESKDVFPKHGGGCVLSSSLASHIKLGISVEEASLMGKRFTEKFLSSNDSLLGSHHLTTIKI